MNWKYGLKKEYLDGYTIYSLTEIYGKSSCLKDSLEICGEDPQDIIDDLEIMLKDLKTNLQIVDLTKESETKNGLKKIILKIIQDELELETGISKDKYSEDMTFLEIGLDSIDMSNLCRTLSYKFCLDLEYDYSERLDFVINDIENKILENRLKEKNENRIN